MGRQKSAPASAATLEPSKAIPVLENLIIRAEELRRESWASQKRSQWIHTGEGALLAALGSGHPTVEAFHTAQIGFSTGTETEGELQQRADSDLEGMVAVLESTVEQLRWHLPDPTQVFLPAGSAHDAYVEIRKIIQLASSEVLIVDTYVDGTLWSLLKNVPAAARIRIMTMKMQGDFGLEAQKFATQHGNTIEIRQTGQYHDRFVLTGGGNRCWHLGASIKDAGNKAFAMSEILSPAIRAAVKADVESTWNTATMIPV